MGRPDKYLKYVKPFLNDIPVWMENQTNEEISKRLRISTTTYYKYMNQYPELAEAVKIGRQRQTTTLKESLIRKAKGFYYVESKTRTQDQGSGKAVVTETYLRYSPPDTGAIHLLLKNIDPEWHNDDMETIKQKRKQMELVERKIDNSDW